MPSFTNLIVIEDNPDDFEAILVSLDETGSGDIPVERCANVGAARQLFDGMRRAAKEGTLNLQTLILLDLKLPDGSGYDLLRELKDDRLLREVPVIILTSSANMSDVRRCYGYGANSYLRKPMELSGFYELMQRLKAFWIESAQLPRLS